MRVLWAFGKKEILERVRSGRLFLLAGVFLALGVMNPAIAKLTPQLLEAMADSLQQSGVSFTAVNVSALDSWMQFFKNAPIALIAFVLFESGSFTREYASGTLIMCLARGLSRRKAAAVKMTVTAALWTIGYAVYFLVTLFYNAYFWQDWAAQNLSAAVCGWWLFGIWVISLTSLFSVLASSGAAVQALTGGAVLLTFLAGLIPRAEKYMPALLTDGNQLIFGAAQAGEYAPAFIITALSSAVCFLLVIPVFQKKRL